MHVVATTGSNGQHEAGKRAEDHPHLRILHQESKRHDRHHEHGEANSHQNITFHVECAYFTVDQLRKIAYRISFGSQIAVSPAISRDPFCDHRGELIHRYVTGRSVEGCDRNEISDQGSCFCSRYSVPEATGGVRALKTLGPGMQRHPGRTTTH